MQHRPQPRINCFMKSLIAFFLGFLPLLISAQASDYQPRQVGEELTSRVLIVPFNPHRYYLSDCDKAIAGESKLRPMEVRNNFRVALDEAMRSYVGNSYVPIDLSTSNGKYDEQVLKRFYRNMKISYEEPTRLADASLNSKWIDRMKGRLNRIKVGQKKNTPSSGTNRRREVEEYSWVSNSEDKYMAAAWPENNFLKDVVKTYNPDYIITINQFEIKTDYRKCVDRELGNFTRRIRVHFNVFNPGGECLFGDVVTATYNSTTEDIENIISDNFGLLGEFISTPLARTLSSN